MKNINNLNRNFFFGFWGLGIRDCVLGLEPNPQSPIPNPQVKKLIKKTLNKIKKNL